MPSTANILLLETSADVCSAALLHQGQITEKNVFEKNSHSKLLASMVSDLLENQQCKIQELDAIAISAGPGSYTGLRIGASLAKGIAFAHDIPIISVSSLASIAQALKEQEEDGDKLYCALIDARREDVYYGIFNSNLELIEPEAFCTVNNDFLKNHLQNEIFIGGTGSLKTAKILGHNKLKVVEVDALARHMVNIALQKYNNKEFEDLAYYEPNYIKSVHIIPSKKNVLS
ncbi:MAG: tRNA (adenosine(37)-N6)-threonylcarbamoyltransferase complex dimerization subunit type 1 TsaB [Bacteroidia bacterium]